MLCTSSTCRDCPLQFQNPLRPLLIFRMISASNIGPRAKGLQSLRNRFLVASGFQCNNAPTCFFEVFHSNQFSSLRCLCTDHSRAETHDFSCSMRTCGLCTSLKLRYPVQTSRDVMVPPDFSNNCSPYTL